MRRFCLDNALYYMCEKFESNDYDKQENDGNKSKNGKLEYCYKLVNGISK